MDLKRYIESEVEEEKEMGLSSAATASTTNGQADGYPGDLEVFVSEGDISTELVTSAAGGVEISAYVARPASSEPSPAVVVIHENKGLVPYITNTARRLAQHGYVAVAPDLLSSVGGTESFAEAAEATKALAELDAQDVVSYVQAVLSQVAKLDGVRSDRLGIIGFCWGGGVTWRVLTHDSRLSAGVPFYGPTPDADAVANIVAPVLGVYGELDERITSMLPAIQKAMHEHDKTFESMILPGAQHAFHNDTNPDRYNSEAAAKAWSACIDFLGKSLKS